MNLEKSKTRGYAWSSQFDDLWKDILRTYYNSSENDANRHYTGMLSLEKISEEDKKNERLSGTNAFYVVDGQQRLTSIIIILKALFEYIKEELDEDIEEEILLLNCINRFDYSRERNDDAKEYFNNRIYNRKKDVEYKTLYLKNIDNAKENIDLKLLLYDGETAKKILNTVLDKIVFNVYFIF